jgi:hypothetical protein
MTTGGGSTEGNQITQQLPWIVGGDWKLDVDKGNVTDFMSNFTMVKADGTKHHGHTISNLTTKSGGIRLDVNGNASFEVELILGQFGDGNLDFSQFMVNPYTYKNFEERRTSGRPRPQCSSFNSRIRTSKSIRSVAPLFMILAIFKIITFITLLSTRE